MLVLVLFVACYCWGFPKVGTFPKVPIKRIMVFGVYIGVPLL